jgi:anti-anti-sigma factor
MNLTVDQTVDSNTLKIDMNGVLDFSTVDSFDYINDTPDLVTHIEVDFSGLEFIDSTGIGAILTILHKAKSFEAKVDFINMSKETEELFSTIGVFDIKKALLSEE